jgi:hypothetical protein
LETGLEARERERRTFRGNPSTANFFSIVRALQKKTHVKLRVTAATG